ncbi:MAG: M48 family metallopeptidase [bacterium]|nr:M48 family metallopeptidase [bacterium]
MAEEKDPYALRDEFDGGLFVKGTPGGRQKARLLLTTEGIEARTDAGSHKMRWSGIKLERANGDMVLVHSGDRRTTVFCDEPGFLHGLEGTGGNDVNDALSRLAGERVSTRTRHMLGCTLAFAVVAVAFWGLPRLFRASIDGVVGALPYSVDEAIGEAVVDAMDAGGEEIEDEVVRDAIQEMLDRMQPHLSLDGVELVFRVIDNEQANAFALPGGYITVFTGLILESDRPEQVAGVLAHEIAHVTERHGLRRIAHSLGLMAGFSVLIGNTEGLLSIAVELFSLASVNDYSQDQETEADLEGVRLMVAAGIDPTALAEFFQKLEELYGDVPDSLSWISTHPQHKERIEAIRESASEGSEWEPLDVDWDAVKAALE